MGIMRFNYRSQTIGHYVDVTIVYPTDGFSYYDMGKNPGPQLMPGAKAKPQYKPGMKFQTVYLIHGGGDDDTLTYRYTNAERYAQDNNVMLVTPNITNSFGADTNYGVRYATFLGEELPVVVQSLFASSPEREDNFIVGYAMGGNAALGNAIMYPERYAACIDISGGIGFTVNTETLKKELEGDHFKNNFPLYNSTFGKADDLDGSRHDMYAKAKKNIEDGVKVPKFHIAVGSREFIFDRATADAETMKELGYDVTYVCAEGYDHDFEFWDEYIKKALYEILPLKREALF